MTLKPPPPDIVIGRLPLYLRALDTLAKENSLITSSYELGERLGISSAQIRKDLSHFGDFGKQGTGYNISYLIEQLRSILQVDRDWPVVVLGTGHVGEALANYSGFTSHGFKIIGLFDSNPKKIGLVVNNLTIQDTALAPQIIREHGVKIAMIATPSEAAQALVDMLVAAGIQAILSYAAIPLNVPPHVQVQYIDPISKLQHMTYYVQE